MASTTPPVVMLFPVDNAMSTPDSLPRPPVTEVPSIVVTCCSASRDSSDARSRTASKDPSRTLTARRDSGAEPLLRVDLFGPLPESVQKPSEPIRGGLRLVA